MAIQFVAAAFFSVQMLPDCYVPAQYPETAALACQSQPWSQYWRSHSCPWRESPAKHVNRTWTFLPALVGAHDFSLPQDVVLHLKACFSRAKLCDDSSHHMFKCAVEAAVGIYVRTHGARAMPSRTATATAPPPLAMAFWCIGVGGGHEAAFCRGHGNKGDERPFTTVMMGPTVLEADLYASFHRRACAKRSRFRYCAPYDGKSMYQSTNLSPNCVDAPRWGAENECQNGTLT